MLMLLPIHNKDSIKTQLPAQVTTHTLQFTSEYTRKNGDKTGIKKKEQNREKENKLQEGTMYGVAAAILLVLPLGLMSQKCYIESKQG